MEVSSALQSRLPAGSSTIQEDVLLETSLDQVAMLTPVTPASSSTRMALSHQPAIKDIIEEQDQNILIACRDVMRDVQFVVGDMAVKYIEKSKASLIFVHHERIFEAIGAFVGVAARTVRYYYETALFFDKEQRKKYAVLPFSAFVAARSYGDPLAFDFLDDLMLMPGVAVAVADRQFKTRLVLQSGAGGGVASQIGGDGDGKVLIPDRIQPPDEYRQQTCEVSQDNDRLEAHKKLAEINHAVRVLGQLYELACEAEICESSRNLILDAIGTLLKHLPEMARALV